VIAVTVRNYRPRKRYGFFRLLIDLILTCCTGGLWLVWLLIKFLRNGSL
jgi:hypothetical protein